MTLPDGLYDLLLTERLARSLDAVDPASSDVLALKSGGAAEFLSDVITRQLAVILDDVGGDASDKASRQLELVNEMLVTLIDDFGICRRAFASAPACVYEFRNGGAMMDAVAQPCLRPPGLRFGGHPLRQPPLIQAPAPLQAATVRLAGVGRSIRQVW